MMIAGLPRAARSAASGSFRARRLLAPRSASTLSPHQGASTPTVGGRAHCVGLFERTAATTEFSWQDYDRACATMIDSPLDQLALIRRQFVNRDGTRPVHDSDQHWLFLPPTDVLEELLNCRHSFVNRAFSKPSYKSRLQKQRELENKAYADALRRYNELNDGFIKRGQIAHHSRLQRQMRKWHKPLTLAIKQEQEDVEKHLPCIDRQSYGPYITLLDAEVLAVITLHEVRCKSPARSSTSAFIHRRCADPAQPCDARERWVVTGTGRCRGRW
jgi:hypothetical protein